MSPLLYEGILVFIFGLIIGSFLNVVAGRLNTGVGMGGRSKCETCSTTLKWYELVPVLSFILLRGKCRSCAVPLSWQYPLVEFATGILYLTAYMAFIEHLDIVRFAAELILFAAIIVIVIYDSKHMVIPQKPLVVFLLAALISHIGFALSVGTWHYVIAALVLFAPFYLLWRVSDGRWIGLGDADLAAGMGLYLGLVNGFVAVALAFIIGGFFAACILMASAFGKPHSREVPFAPFLLAGFVAVYCITTVGPIRDVIMPAVNQLIVW